MSGLDIAGFLARCPVFAELDPAQRAVVTAGVEERYFAKGRFVLRQGGEATQFYVIEKGRVALEVAGPGRTPVTLQTLGSGDVLGWSWLVSPYSWHFDARALDEVQTVAFDAKRLRELMDRDPVIGYRLARRFLSITTERLQSARMQLLDVYGRY